MCPTYVHRQHQEKSLNTKRVLPDICGVPETRTFWSWKPVYNFDGNDVKWANDGRQTAECVTTWRVSLPLWTSPQDEISAQTWWSPEADCDSVMLRQYVAVFAQMSGVAMASLVSLWDTLNKTCNNFKKYTWLLWSRDCSLFKLNKPTGTRGHPFKVHNKIVLTNQYAHFFLSFFLFYFLLTEHLGVSDVYVPYRLKDKVLCVV